MTTETTLTDDQIEKSLTAAGVTGYWNPMSRYDVDVVRAVLQSPEIQALKKDAERVEFIEVHYGADIVCFDSGNWEVSSGDMCFGEGLSLRSAIDDAMEQQK